jgi:hypothetical protein
MHVVLRQDLLCNTIFALRVDLSPSSKHRQHRIAVVTAGRPSLVCYLTYQLLTIPFWCFTRISKRAVASKDYYARQDARYVLAELAYRQVQQRHRYSPTVRHPQPPKPALRRRSFRIAAKAIASCSWRWSFDATPLSMTRSRNGGLPPASQNEMRVSSDCPVRAFAWVVIALTLSSLHRWREITRGEVGD